MLCWGRYCYFFRRVYASSGVYQLCTWGLFLRGQSGRSVKLGCNLFLLLKVKEEWNLTFTSLYVFTACTQDSFTFFPDSFQCGLQLPNFIELSSVVPSWNVLKDRNKRLMYMFCALCRKDAWKWHKLCLESPGLRIREWSHVWCSMIEGGMVVLFGRTFWNIGFRNESHVKIDTWLIPADFGTEFRKKQPLM